MILADVEWIGTLCTALALACSIQLVITGVLAVTISEALLFTGSHLSTGTGLVAGFVALPAALRTKTAQLSPETDRTYGYTICYQRLAVCIAALLHFTAAVLAIVGLALAPDLTDEFFGLMKSYHSAQNSKALADNVQYALQCCGATSYQDWFKLDWGGFQNAMRTRRGHRLVPQFFLFKEEEEADPDSPSAKSDSVPFSCCSRASRAACVHQNLAQLGTRTINVGGCGKKLAYVTRGLLWFEFFLYLLCLALEITVCVLLGPSPFGKGGEDGKGTRAKGGRRFLSCPPFSRGNGRRRGKRGRVKLEESNQDTSSTAPDTDFTTESTATSVYGEEPPSPKCCRFGSRSVSPAGSQSPARSRTSKSKLKK